MCCTDDVFPLENSAFKYLLYGKSSSSLEWGFSYLLSIAVMKTYRQNDLACWGHRACYRRTINVITEQSWCLG